MDSDFGSSNHAGLNRALFPPVGLLVRYKSEGGIVAAVRHT